MSHDLKLRAALQQLLHCGKAGSQRQIVAALSRQGFSVNQSKISRLLRHCGAVKVENEQGHLVYALPKEPAPPSADSPLSRVILEISHNEYLIVIHTSPGAASLIARLIDYRHQQNSHILGSLAGDDTVFVTPTKTEAMAKALAEVKSYLSSFT